MIGSIVCPIPGLQTPVKAVRGGAGRWRVENSTLYLFG